MARRVASSFSRPKHPDSGLLHSNGKPMSDGEVDLTVALATSADGQADGGHEHRVVDKQGLRTGVRTTHDDVGLTAAEWVLPGVDDDDAQANTLAR